MLAVVGKMVYLKFPAVGFKNNTLASLVSAFAVRRCLARLFLLSFRMALITPRHEPSLGRVIGYWR